MLERDGEVVTICCESAGLAITICAFKNSINLSCSEVRQIERNT